MASRVLSVIARSSSRKIRGSSCRPRGFSSASSGGGSPYHNIPLSQALPGIPTPKHLTIDNQNFETKVTTLDNGMRVATENKSGQFCTVGVLLDSGSRYEVGYPSGITHYLEKLSFCSTEKFNSRDEVLQKLEEYSGICDCQGSRDTLIYAVSAGTRSLPSVVDLLSEITLKPRITDQELADSRMAITFELESLDMQPDPEPLLVELIHAAAYRDNTLGLPKIASPESLAQIDRSMLYTYFHNYHTPERLVLAGVGVDHGELVQLAQKHFEQTTPIWESESSLIDPSRGMDLSISQYTGGIIKEEKDLSNVSLGPNPMPELAHCVIGLESCSHRDPDFIPFCVLNMMMGGGGSFSAGGPGKGMYTRLYLNVLNRHHWMYSATAYNHAYADSGIFCIHASSHPSQLRDLVEVVVKELVATQYGISKTELNRAKTQLQSMLLMNLENRPVIFEDIGRQVLGNGHRLPATHYIDEISAITEADIQRVASRMLQSSPAVAALGDLTHLPSYDEIRNALSSREGRMPRKFRRLFT